MKKTIMLILSFLLLNSNFLYKKNQEEEVYYRFETEEPLICLTFDDGPDKTQTYRVLNILDKYKIKATFFVLGQEIENQTEVLKDIYNKGHDIGNHFYKHENIYKTDEKDIRNSIEKTNDLIEKCIGYRPTILRPPYGFVNDSLKKISKDLNMKIIIWTADKDSKDWAMTKDYIICKNLLKSPKNGDIFLFHDSNVKFKNTLSSLDNIILALQKKGYKFVTISEMFAEKKF